jgi:hypothetical protein
MEEPCLLGAGTRGRTRDLRFTKPLLCQLSYAGVMGILPRARVVTVAGTRSVAG